VFSYFLRVIAQQPFTRINLSVPGIPSFKFTNGMASMTMMMTARWNAGMPNSVHFSTGRGVRRVSYRYLTSGASFLLRSARGSFREFAPINSARLSARVRSKESRARIPARVADFP